MHTTSVSRSRRSKLLLGIGVLALLAACSKSGDSADDSPATTVSVAPSTELTAEDDTESTDSEPADAGDDDPWRVTAVDHRGADGETFTYDCPAGGEAVRIWGDGTYTDDSSICTAAVHAGLITFEEGGEVEIEILAGQEKYVGALSNEVESDSYGEWGGSFLFPEAPSGSGSSEAGLASWTKTASSLGVEVGDTDELTCSRDGEPSSVWGTDTYTADSSICTAAVHAGLIDLDDGGPVRFEVVDGLKEYVASTQNGVTSRDYGEWDPAFRFTDDQPTS